MKVDTTLNLAGRFDVVQYSLLRKMKSKRPALIRVECALICIKPDNKQIPFDGRINAYID